MSREATVGYSPHNWVREIGLQGIQRKVGCWITVVLSWAFLVPFHILLHQKYVQKISKAPTWRSYLKVKGFVFLVHFLFVLDCLWMSIIVPYVDAKPSAAAAGTTRPSQTKHLKVEQVHLQDRTVCASLNVTVHYGSFFAAFYRPKLCRKLSWNARNGESCGKSQQLGGSQQRKSDWSNLGPTSRNCWPPWGRNVHVAAVVIANVCWMKSGHGKCSHFWGGVGGYNSLKDSFVVVCWVILKDFSMVNHRFLQYAW